MTVYRVYHVDTTGRLMIPIDARRDAAIKAGDWVSVRYTVDHGELVLRIKPAPA